MILARKIVCLITIAVFTASAMNCKKDSGGNAPSPAQPTKTPAPKRNSSEISLVIEDIKRTAKLDQLIFKYGDSERGQFYFTAADEEKKPTVLLYAKFPRELMKEDGITSLTVWKLIESKAVEILPESSQGPSFITLPEIGELKIKQGSAFIVEKYAQSSFPNEIRIAGRMRLNVDIGKIPTTISGQFRVYALPQKIN